MSIVANIDDFIQARLNDVNGFGANWDEAWKNKGGAKAMGLGATDMWNIARTASPALAAGSMTCATGGACNPFGLFLITELFKIWAEKGVLIEKSWHKLWGWEDVDEKYYEDYRKRMSQLHGIGADGGYLKQLDKGYKPGQFAKAAEDYSYSARGARGAA